MVEFKLVDHLFRPVQIVEIWMKGCFCGSLYPQEPNGVRLISRYAFLAADDESNAFLAADDELDGCKAWRFAFRTPNDGGAPAMTDVDERMAKEYRHQQLLETAVQTADRILLDGCEGDEADLLLLTTEMAMKFVQKTRIMAQARVNRREFLREQQNGEGAD